MATTSKNTKSKGASAKSGKKTSAKATTSGRKKSSGYDTPPDAPNIELRQSVKAGVFFILAILVGISYFSDEGSVIALFSDFFKGMIGWGYWLLAAIFVMAACIIARNKDKLVGFRVFSALMLPVLFSAMMNLSKYPSEKITEFQDFARFYEMGQNLKCGGLVSGFLAVVFDKAFGEIGAYALIIISFVFFLMKSAGTGLSGIAGKVRENAEKYAQYDDSSYEDEELTLKKPDNKAKKEQETQQAKSQQSRKSARFPSDIPLDSDDVIFQPVSVSASGRQASRRTASVMDIPLNQQEDDSLPFENLPSEKIPSRTAVKKSVKVQPEKSKTPTDNVKPMTEEEAANLLGIQIEKPAVAKTEGKPTRAKPSIKKIETVSRGEAEKTQTAEKEVPSSEEQKDYTFPPITLLNASPVTADNSKEEILANRTRLEAALHSFGINANIVEIIHGPTVTRYDIELEQGVKLSRVTNLAGDLALSLGVVNVRISPIPDKISTVGIEVPNRTITTVFLRDIIDSNTFRTAKSKLSFAVGKDIGGNCVVGNISKLPHMLIAGTTGSGKSVCMNSLILSLLYKSRPEEVKMIMIDPKMVELGVYNGIPHLYVPVVTDPKKASGALQWSVVEMLKRYRLFSEASVRDLDSYNSYCQANGRETMPRIVIIIDELADLMIAASKEVEESICRVAQMGRAAGMHLIIATQRPSADVITGLMKANIPSRIAFAVSSALESRIILDQGGADKLIGMGDMLYSPIGCGKPTRVQGAFVSDEEREEIIGFIKEQYGSVSISAELTEFMNQAAEKSSDDKASSKKKDESSEKNSGGYDEMLAKAVDVVIEMKSCSVSMLQRRIKLGYSRAARIVDQMEEIGVVGPYEGSKPRAVIVDRDQWNEMKLQLGLTSDEDLDVARSISEESEEDVF